MKNASRLLYIVSVLFGIGFFGSFAEYLKAGPANSAPLWVALVSNAILFLLPALIAFLVARWLGRKQDPEIRKIDPRVKYKIKKMK